ncbi:unnamed protein product [Phytomonas sp. EM1]|nr:unnamed protein product [Phytomonas sp. EM1]|eukprot:CCW62776.1 unnamed protein product [Phytomonas sp. isolate EM1]
MSHVDSSKRVSGKASALQHTLSSQCGSAVSTIILYPIDVIRIRYMSQDGTFYRQHNGQTYHSIKSACKAIYEQEGLGAFFRGCHVAIIGSVCAWGIYMYLYRLMLAGYTNQIAPLFGKQESQTAPRNWMQVYGALDTFVQRSGISILASCACAVMCNPIWLVKTRMQLEECAFRAARGDALKVPRYYRTFCESIHHTVRTTGFLSLWRGVSAQVLLGVPNAFNLPLYETIKLYLTSGSREEQLTLGQVFVCSTATKLILSIFTHPIAVLKTRMQDYRALVGDIQYEHFFQSLNVVWRRGGVWDFYRGMVPSLIHSTPRSVLLFIFYEQFLKIFSKVID